MSSHFVGDPLAATFRDVSTQCSASPPSKHDTPPDGKEVSRRTTDGLKQLSVDAAHGRVYPNRSGPIAAELCMGSVMTGLGIAVMCTGVGVLVGAVLIFVGLCLDGKSLLSLLPATRLKGTPRPATETRSEITGLNNSGVDCYANAALQFLRGLEPELHATFRRTPAPNPHFTIGSSQYEQDIAEKNTFRSETVRYLEAFFDGNVQTFADCRKLRRQVLKGVQGDSQFPQWAAGISRCQCDAAEYLGRILDRAAWPCVMASCTTTKQKDNEVKMTATDEPCSMLPLEITGAHSVQEAFDLFTRQEELGEDDWLRWDDNDPNSKVPTGRQWAVKDPSDCLVLNLKRFETDPVSSETVKNQADVTIGRLTIPADHGKAPQTYEPHALICHQGGTATSGHYVAFRKIDGAWWKFDDTEVSRVDSIDDDVIRQNAYVALYRRVPTS